MSVRAQITTTLQPHVPCGKCINYLLRTICHPAFLLNIGVKWQTIL